MSDLEDFKLGGMHNAGDPDGLRIVESKNKWAALADRIEALGLPRPIKGEKVMPLFERVVAAFEKERAKYRFQYVGDLHGTPVHLHQDPPTSTEPDVMRLVDAYVLLHVDALDDHPIVLEARAAIIAALKTR